MMGSLEAESDLDSESLRAALDATRLLVLVVDGMGVVRAANRAVERATAFSKESLRAPIWDLATIAQERAFLRSLFSPLKLKEFPQSVLFHLVATAGTESRVIDWDVQVFNGGRDNPSLVFVGIDLSSRLAAQEDLRETGAFQRLVLERLPGLLWTTDTELRCTSSTGAGLAALGFAPRQTALVGTSLFAYFSTADPRHLVVEAHLGALRGEPTEYPIELGGRKWHARVEPLRDGQGRIVGTIGIAFDVTESAKVTEALSLSEARLRRLVDSNVIGIIFADETGRVTEANDAVLQILGYSREELLSGAVSWKGLTPPEYATADERAIAEVKSAGRSTPYGKEFIAKDGTRIPVLLGGASLPSPSGRPPHGVVFVLDMREQVRLRQTRDQLLLKEQAARIHTEIANARLLLLVEGSKRLARSLNIGDALESLASVVVPSLADWSFVAQRDQNGGLSVVASAHGDPNKQELLRSLHSCRLEPNAPEGASHALRTGEVAIYENITIDQLSPRPPAWPIVGTRDPEHLHTLCELGMKSLLCVPIRCRQGVDAVLMLVSATDPHRYDAEDIVLARDLADRAAVTLENGRLLSEAVEAVKARDDFLAVAAHELRTPLTSLLLQIQLLDQALERARLEPDAARRGVAMAEAQARRLSALIDGLLDIARLTSHRMLIRVEETDLRALLDGLLAALEVDLQRAGCKIAVNAPEHVTGRWDRMRIEQVLANLISNAMKFGAGKPIEVNVESTDATVRISVRDHGIGISKEDQARIFGRFERAVPTRHFGGLGLGLYISAQILRAHQGSLGVESTPGQGACFTVEMPRRVQLSAATTDKSEWLTS